MHAALRQHYRPATAHLRLPLWLRRVWLWF